MPWVEEASLTAQELPWSLPPAPAGLSWSLALGTWSEALGTWEQYDAWLNSLAVSNAWSAETNLGVPAWP